jgi:hypothetical protein
VASSPYGNPYRTSWRVANEGVSWEGRYMMGIVSAVSSILGGPVGGPVYGSDLRLVEQMGAHSSQPRELQAVPPWLGYTAIIAFVPAIVSILARIGWPRTTRRRGLSRHALTKCCNGSDSTWVCQIRVPLHTLRLEPCVVKYSSYN